MRGRKTISPVRVLPEDVANKIAAGEVVERPASVVKELVENALDAGATRISVKAVAAGRRTIEVIDNGHGMSEQDAILAIERHSTSKIRKAEDLDNIATLGFRGEALASIASVSRFELITRRDQDESATRIQIDGGILRSVSQVGAPVGTKVTANRLYFNTPVRAKFLKGVTTELSHCVDIIQRHALSHPGVGFQFVHNEKTLLDIPERAGLRERAALIWGLAFIKDLIEISGEQGGFRFGGLIATPALTRSSRSHQYFFLNGRPIQSRPIQYGFADGFQGLLTIGRHPVGIVLIETHPRFVDVNIHPAKREVRFRDERAARAAIRDVVRATLESVRDAPRDQRAAVGQWERPAMPPRPLTPTPPVDRFSAAVEENGASTGHDRGASQALAHPVRRVEPSAESPETLNIHQIEMPLGVEPQAVYRAVGKIGGEPVQLFETYLLVPEEDRLLIIDQHALHERLNYDNLFADLQDSNYEAQQLAVPILVDVPPAHARLLEANLELFSKLGMEIEPFGGKTFQVTAICHLYEERKIADAIYRVLDELAQGNLFDREDFLADFLRLATEACRASVKAGDRLTAEEKQELVDGFRRMRPPYTCPHGRPIITELTLTQMEKSFRRRQ